MWQIIAMVAIELVNLGYQKYQSDKNEDRLDKAAADAKAAAAKQASKSLWQAMQNAAAGSTIMRRDKMLLEQQFEHDKAMDGSDGKWKLAKKASKEAHKASLMSGGTRRNRPLGNTGQA